MQSTRSARATWRAPALLSLAIAGALMAPAPAGAASAYNPETGKTARYITYDPALAAADKAATIAAGLRAPGTITYDREGVPVIQAANDLDAAYLLGYAHARDRFFQMDYFRRVPSGTLAELLGPAALANDVQLRTLGLRRAAFASWVALGDEPRGILKAYADGVNFWLSTNPLPPEYGAIETTRALAWSPVDSIVMAKLLAFQLSFDLDTDFTIKLGAYQQAGQAAGFNGAALFFEDTHRSQPGDNRVSIPGFRPTAGGGEAAAVPDKSAAAPVVSPELQAMAQALQDSMRANPWIAPALERRASRRGSNWWIVDGSKTVSGRPILSNDPHLGLDTPTIFQEVHVVSSGSGMNVVGASFPGTPAVLLGCTERFCWGLTTNPLDVTDAYQESFIVNTYGLPTHTIYRGQAEPVQLVFQSYVVNRFDGTPDNAARDNSIGYLNGGVTVLVPRRNNGPVLSITGTSGLSAQYTGWGATFELEAFRKINKAQNLEQFREAVTYFDAGSQNFAYADMEGNIAYFTSAENPIRDDLQNLNAPDGTPPSLIRDGTGARRNEWLPVANRIPNQAVPYEVMPATEMPFVVNPASGYIVNCNNDPVGNTLDNNPLNQLRPGGGLYYLNFGYASYRNGRVDRVLQDKFASGSKITVADMQKLQANNQPLDAQLVLPYLLAAEANASATGAWSQLASLVNEPRVSAALARLKEWDLSTPTGIREGYDPGDNPASLPEPSAAEIRNSTAATLFAVFRNFAIRNTIDATLGRVGLTNYVPAADISYIGLKYALDNYATRRGVGASGLNFFAVQGAPSPEAARDYLLVKSLKDGLDLLASPAFAPAFNGSTNVDDYRWGKLHRIVFDHPLGGPFNIPDANATYGFANLSPQLPGLARPGGYEVVDDSDHSVKANTLNGFMFGGGPARRFIGEMTATPTLQQILPGGQSGVLGSPFYASQLGRWLTNQYKPLNISVAVATQAPLAVLDFVPRQ